MITANGIQIEPTIFPDKTSQVWKIDDRILKEKTVEIVWDFESEAEFIHVAQLKYLLDFCEPRKEVSLFMPYLPYARQDKTVSNQSTFALSTFSYLLQTMNFSKVLCFDRHSDAPLSILPLKIHSVPPIQQVLKAIDDCFADVLVYPDAGALRKYQPLFTGMKEHAHADKIRDQLTGEIKGLVLHGDVKGKRCLIVDDICDGGMTFIKLAHLLIANGAIEVDLYVSHGLFTKGLQVLKDAGINRIYTRKGKLP